MSKAKFLIFPSEWYEGFSITLLEAFVNRLPVLSSNIGSMQEIIENNVNGILFKSGDVSDLIKKINKMIENPDMLKTLKDKAYEKYQILYSKKKNYETLVSIYKEVRGDYSI
jgi:glycosyltransferase involved in cell wall biosynthesis